MKMKRSICLPVIGSPDHARLPRRRSRFSGKKRGSVGDGRRDRPRSLGCISVTAPDGGKSTSVAGPEIRNFDQIHVGDEVKVTYRRRWRTSPRARQARPRPTTPRRSAPAGAKPGAAVRQIDHHDRAHRIGGYLVRRRDLQAAGWLRAHHHGGFARRQEVHPHAQEGRHGGRDVHRGAGYFGGPGQVSRAFRRSPSQLRCGGDRFVRAPTARASSPPRAPSIRFPSARST